MFINAISRLLATKMHLNTDSQVMLQETVLTVAYRTEFAPS